MTDVAARLAALSPEKRALVERMLAEGRREQVFPVSVLQEGMWFLEQLHPGNTAYVGLSAVRVDGTHVRADLLAAAVDDLVRRHEVARTTFELRDGRPVQVVRPHHTIPVPETDLRGTSPSAERLEALAVAAVLATPFDIAAEPPVRLALLRLDDDASLLVAAAHHLLFDRQAFGLLLGELSTLYDGLVAGAPVHVPEPPVQYGDFATWQRQQRDAGAWEPDRRYWRGVLTDLPSPLALPTDRPRPVVQGLRGAQLPVELPADLMERLGAFARSRGATTYMALLTVYAVLLHRCSGQDDLVVAAPATMRDRPETEALLGYFINTLPLRVRLDGRPTFGELLDRVRAVCLGAYAHQAAPFDVLVADLNLPRELSRSAVHQASFTYGREPVPRHGFGGRLRRVPLRVDSARYDLELQAFHDGGVLHGWLEYDRDLFDEATVERLAADLRRLAEAAVDAPDRSVDDVRLLVDDRREQVFAQVNDTARDWPVEDGLVHECIARQAARTPDAPAVLFGGTTVTYGELDARANALAHRLVRLGVGRDVLVGVGMQRSVELVVALLAVLKAGGAYVPLDPALPAARLVRLVDGARPRVVLVQPSTRAAFDGLGPQVLCLDTASAPLAGAATSAPDVAVDGEDPVYVIYTSGSTGVPKGVTNVHAALRNRLLWMQDALRLDPSDRVLQKTPFSFDVSVWEFFWPLMQGAALVVAEPGGHRDPAYLHRVVTEQGITTLHFVPSMLRAFLREPLETCTSLRRVVCSGEALPRDVHDEVLARSGAELHNLYGPTEAAIDVTHWRCRPGGAGPVPIGRPIANTQVHVLDADARPVPLEVPGELYLGGRNLARGYLGQPGLTAERFVPDPSAPAGRLYRTGDLVRMRRDGELEFLGRLDDQVKIRGLRVELGEVELALAAVPGVRQAVVTAHEVRPGDTRLVGYVTVEPDAAPDVTRLRSLLRAELPEHMVPGHVVVLDTVPVTSNGKVDRAALPSPGDLRPDAAGPFVAPADALEDAVAAVWRDVLGVERVGRHDSFFDLGGHSLLLAEVRALLAERHGHDVPMVVLFQCPTVATLAAHLGGAQPTAQPSAEAQERAALRRRSTHRRPSAAGAPAGTPTDR